MHRWMFYINTLYLQLYGYYIAQKKITGVLRHAAIMDVSYRASLELAPDP